MPGKIRFGVYELDRDAMELRKHGAPIRLQEQPFRVLAMLAERPGEVISREQLQEKIWGNTFVDFDQSLNKAVNRIREALNDNAGTPQYIETVPRRGYRFIAPVAAIPQTEEPAVVNLGPAEEPARPGSPKSPSRRLVLAALTMASVLATIGIIAITRLRQSRKPALQEARLIKSFGWELALSRDGKLLAYAISGRGQKVGPTFQLALPEGGTYASPSLSRDGRWMAYDTYNPGQPNAILLRDLSTGTDHILDETGRRESFLADNGETSISPDGSRVLFERDGKARRWPDNVQSHLPNGFMAAAADGKPEQVCELCTPRGFSSDGSVVLLQKYAQTDQNKDRIVALDLRTRTEHDFLSQRDKPLYHAFFSWDDRWVVFKRLLPAGAQSQILIAQVVRGAAADQAEWIAVTDGGYEDDKPQFSPDGNTVYFTSTRDGYLCIWAQRLDPMTKHPLGPPFAFEHFHNSEGRGGAYHLFSSDLAVARDKILINLPHINHDIWMTQMP